MAEEPRTPDPMPASAPVLPYSPPGGDPSNVQAYMSSVQGGSPAAPSAPAGPQVPADPADALMAARTGNTEAAIANIQGLRRDQMGTINTPTPQPRQPQYRDIPPAPQPQFHDVFKDSAPGLIFATVMGSMMSRRHGMGAMQAAGSYMEGFKKGDQEAMENARVNWKNQVDGLIAQNRVESERYEAAWKGTAISQQDKMAKVNAYAASIGDQATIAALRNGNVDFAEKLYQDRRNAVEKMREADLKYGQTGGMTDRDVEAAAQKAIAKGGVIDASLFRGVQGNQDRRRVWHEIVRIADERGITDRLPKMEQQFKAEQVGLSGYARTAGSYGARVETAVNEVEQLLPQAIETSRALPRGKIVPLNSLIQRWEQGTSDPAYNDFLMANFSLINAYTRAMNPSGVPRITERFEQKAIGLLSMATSQEAYEVQARRLWKEVQASKTAVAGAAEGRKPGDINAPPPWEAQGDHSGMSDAELKAKLGIK